MAHRAVSCYDARNPKETTPMMPTPSTFCRRLLLLPCALLALALPATAADSFSATVLEVPQPDLFLLQRDKEEPLRLRLYAADAPEPGQAEADAATAFVKSLLKDATVQVEVLTKDDLGVDVGTVTLADGRSLAVLLVESGLAWWDEPNAPEAREVKSANVKAMTNQQGLWKAPGLAPWDFRRSHGGEKYTYSVKAAAPAPAEPEKVVLKAKGDMTESAPSASAMSLPGGIEVPAEVAPLIEKHKPRIATDEAGNPIGLTADDIGNIPFAGMLGFQNGDIFTAVDGMSIRSEADVLGLVSQLKGKKKFNITVRRGGRPVDIPINIP